MLAHIAIKDFAIIEHTELELETGMTALTGETGAGKSILLDALGLLLGDRANSNTVRQGAKKADITAQFTIQHLPGILNWLEENDYDADGDCIIRRVVSSEGKSRSYINGHPVPLQTTRLLGAKLVEIHGQHEHQSLTQRATQQNLLDQYADNAPSITELEALFSHWKAAHEQHVALQATLEERDQRIETLRYQVQEMEGLDLTNEAIQSLEREHARLANLEKLLAQGQAASTLLYESDHSAHSLLARAEHCLQDIGQLDDQLAPIQELVASALVHTQEAANTLTDYLSQADMDAGTFMHVEQQLRTLHDLANKHKVPLEMLDQKRAELITELDKLDAIEQDIDSAMAAVTFLTKEYLALAKSLSIKRSEAAKRFGKEITDIMQTLNMTGGQLVVSVTHHPDKPFTSTGLDQIELLVSANPGQSPMPLSKVASGGELSRISLAIQMVAHRYSSVPTLIFDEVDAGIGGATAASVGKLLRTLGESCQVLCVTHLPQVAAQSHHHIKVDKTVKPGATQTGLETLTEQKRIEEIARMLGGEEITQQTRSHAAEMLAKTTP